MPKIIFYDYVVAYFPARVRLLLNEKEFTHKHVNIDIFYGENMSRDFCKINKNMTLPVVTVDDQVMSQSMEICQYLHTLNPFGKDSDPALVKKFVDLIKDWDGNSF